MSSLPDVFPLVAWMIFLSERFQETRQQQMDMVFRRLLLST